MLLTTQWQKSCPRRRPLPIPALAVSSLQKAAAQLLLQPLVGKFDFLLGSHASRFHRYMTLQMRSRTQMKTLPGPYHALVLKLVCYTVARKAFPTPIDYFC